MGLEVGGFDLVTVHHVGFGLNLSRPVHPGILPERIDDPVERQCRSQLCGLDLQAARTAGPVQEELERHDVAEVERSLARGVQATAAGMSGQPAHAVDHGVNLAQSDRDEG